MRLAAFADSRGGVLVLGVDDATRDILSIDRDKLDQVESLAREICQVSTKPPLVASISKLELPDELGAVRAVVRVDVPPAIPGLMGA